MRHQMVPKHWKYIVIVVSLFVTIFTLSAFPKQDEGSVPTTVTPIPTLAPDPTNSSDLQSLQNIYPTPTSKLGEPIPVPTVIVGEAQVLVKAPTILTTINVILVGYHRRAVAWNKSIHAIRVCEVRTVCFHITSRICPLHLDVNSLCSQLVVVASDVNCPIPHRVVSRE